MNELIEIKSIKAIPAKVEGLDFDKARAAIEDKLQVYSDMVVTDENTPAIKKIIAELRKESKDLNDIKIKIKKELTKNVTEMETEFKALIGLYDNAVLPLDSKVKEYERQEYEKRKKAVLEYAQGIVEGTGFTLADLETPEKWFNKGTSESYINEDVTEQIASLKEKVSAVTELVTAKNAILGTNDLKVEFYSMSYPLHQLISKINADFEALKRRSEIEKAKQTPKVEPEAVPEPVPFEDISVEPTIEDFTAPWEVHERVPVYIDAEDLQAVKSLLKANNIPYIVM